MIIGVGTDGNLFPFPVWTIDWFWLPVHSVCDTAFAFCSVRLGGIEKCVVTSGRIWLSCHALTLGGFLDSFIRRFTVYKIWLFNSDVSQSSMDFLQNISLYLRTVNDNIKSAHFLFNSRQSYLINKKITPKSSNILYITWRLSPRKFEKWKLHKQ